MHPQNWLANKENDHLTPLMTWLSFASVSTDNGYKKEIENCATYTELLLREAGFPTVKQVPTPGHPIIYGEWIVDPTLPTLLIYGHYDVQPPDPLELWETPPFTPTIRENQLFARGASDDKGQVYCHIRAIQAYYKTTGAPPINIKCLIEGEEEIGSPNLQPFILANTNMLQSDIALVSDTPMIGKDRPSLCTSLRGLVYAEVSLRTANTDLHSGQHGGAVPNALWTLTHLLHTLKNKEGKIQIPGFYDGVPELTPNEKIAIRTLPHNDTDYGQELGLSHLEGEVDFHTLERRWYRPTLDINGLWGGYTGPGSKTVIPALAHAKVSMRLVGKQNPEKIATAFTKSIQENAPKNSRVTVQIHSLASPVQVAANDPFVAAAHQALELAFNTPCVLQGEGGTIPVVADFKNILGINTILMGLNLPNDGIHAPNERIAINNIERGMLASLHFLDQCAKIK